MCKGCLGAPLIKKDLRKVQKIEAGKARKPCSVGSRGPLKGHSGGSGAKPPEALLFFNAETAFQTQTYIGLRKILPFPTTSAPARLRLPVPHVSTKPLKSSLGLHEKILFYI